MAKKQTIENIEVQTPITQAVSFAEVEVKTPETKIKKGIVRKISPQRFFLIVLILIAIAGVYGSYYFYAKYSAIKANPNLEAQKETEALVLAVSKLMELPTNETPTIATVSDKEKLKDQPFFTAAENGDVLLTYTKAMQAILYRPKTNKIINVAPINLSGNSAEIPVTKQSTNVSASDIKVAYYNGTPTVGLALNAEKIIKKQFSNFQTVALASARKTDYKETIVVDLSGEHSQEVIKVANLLNGKVAPMPPLEVRPDADILIISGQ